MFGRIVFSACLAGLLSGLVLTGVQMVTESTMALSYDFQSTFGFLYTNKASPSWPGRNME